MTELSMKIRPLRYGDIEEIEQFHHKFYEGEFNLPNIYNIITHAIVEDGDEILGFGEVKVFAEAIMILNKNKSPRDKVKTMQALMTKAILDCKSKGIEQLHVSVPDEIFADILRKHYEFNTVKNIILVRNL